MNSVLQAWEEETFAQKNKLSVYKIEYSWVVDHGST